MLLHPGIMATPALVLPTFDPTKHGTNTGSITNGNLRTTFGGVANFSNVFTTLPIASTQASGKYYLEVDNSALNNANGGIGFGRWAGNATTTGGTSAIPGSDANTISLNAGNSLKTTGVYGVAIDFANKLAWYYHPVSGWLGAGAAAGDPETGVNGISFAGLNAGSYGVMVCGGNTCIYDINFGQSAFTHAMPVGYGLWGA